MPEQRPKLPEAHFRFRSESAMLGYLNAPSPFDEDGWYDTGDQVETDGEYIRILGRKSEIINVGGEKVFPAEVESVFLEIPNVRDVLITAEKIRLRARLSRQRPCLKKRKISNLSESGP